MRPLVCVFASYMSVYVHAQCSWPPLDPEEKSPIILYRLQVVSFRSFGLIFTQILLLLGRRHSTFKIEAKHCILFGI